MALSSEIVGQLDAALRSRRQAEAGASEDATPAPEPVDNAPEEAQSDAQAPAETEGSPELEFLRPDPSDHPDVAKKKKDLESGWTKARQAEAQKVRELEAALEEASAKSKGFDLLLANPDPTKLIEQLKAGTPNQSAAQAPYAGNEFVVPKEVVEGLDEKSLQLVLQLMDAKQEYDWNTKRLSQLQPYVALIEGYGAKQYDQVWSGLEAKYPGCSKFRKETEQAAVKHGLDTEAALLVASKGTVVGSKERASVLAKKTREPTGGINGAPSASTSPAAKVQYSKKALATLIASKAKELGLPDRFTH
jgi:hypothetical protein